MKAKFLHVFFWILPFMPLYLSAQESYRHNWYFGNSTNAIRFSRSDNTPSLVSKSVPFGVGGSAVATDPVTANLLFSTDGARVYDAVSNNVMANGNGLNGDPTRNQPAAICKVPGQKSQYYIFHADATGQVSYSIVDMALPGNAVFPSPPLGAVTTKNSTIAGLTGRSEAMITLPHENGEDYWLLTQVQGSTNYSIASITASGVTVLPTAPIGLITEAINFAYHAPTQRIAVTPGEANRNIEILHFNVSTGALTLERTVANSSFAGNSLFDTEWSNSGQYLYVSILGNGGTTGNVMQFHLSPTSTSASILPQPVYRSYGIQMAPDSAIYHLYQRTAGSAFELASITDTDTVAAQVTYNAAAFTGSPNFNGTQFPNFSPKDTVGLFVDFTTAGTCANSPVSFYPTVIPGADSLVWEFGDGQRGSEWSPVHTYESGGDYEVTLKAFINGDSTLRSHTLSLEEFDLQLSLVSDTTACICEYKPPVGSSCNGGPFTVTVQAQGGAGTPRYQWFGPSGLLTGQTSENLIPDSAGYYYVVATIGNCSAYAGVNIKTYDSLDNRANIWYFGTNAGIDFNPAFENPPRAPQPIQGPLDTPEGCAVISDRNGQVIFSTDGQRIFDKENNEITPSPNPPGLGGKNASTQSALIIPVAGDETLYYIFTTQPTEEGQYELRYSLFDLKEGTAGAVTQYNQLLFKLSTERITGNANWLIAHEYGNNSFRAYRVTPQGISNPVISAIGSNHSVVSPVTGQGYMELGPQNQLGVALSTPGVSNVIELFDFIDSTGHVTNYRLIDLEQPSGQVYGLEFSPAGQKLFATVLGTQQFFELAYDSATSTYTKRAQLPVQSTGDQWGAIQRGPDQRIYIAVEGSSTLQVLGTVSEDDEIPSSVDPNGFALLPGTTSHLGLPNFIQNLGNPRQEPGMMADGFCLGSPTSFSATGKDPVIDKFDWYFGDGQIVIDGGPEIEHTYATAGNFLATVVIYNKCEVVDTLEQRITINPPPANPPLLGPGSQPVICNDEPTTLLGAAADDPNLTYEWSTGETTRTIQVIIPNRYSVTVTNQFGCTAADTVDIYPYFNNLELGPDQTICQDTPRQLNVNIQGPGINYRWYVNDIANTNTTRRQTVDTSVPGQFEYKVEVSDAYCSASDSVNYTINPKPQFNTTKTDPTDCAIDDGQIQLNITSPNSQFSYTVTGPQGYNSSQTNQGTGTYPFNNLGGGVYSITVSDQVSGCRAQGTETLNDPPSFTIAVSQNGDCDPDITLQIQTSATAPLDYRVIDSNSGAVVEEVTGLATIPPGGITTDPASEIVGGGSYIVEITSAGCTNSSPRYDVTQRAAYEVEINEDALCSDNTVSAVTTNGTPTIFDWSESEGLAQTPPPTTAVAALQQGGPWDLVVTVSDPANIHCPGTATLTVTVGSPLTADFSQTTACADQVTLNAAPAANNLLYRWTRDGQQFAGGPQVFETINGTNYSVQIVNTTTGCFGTSPTKPVNVNGALNVTLTNSFPCEGTPFTFTAAPSRAATSFEWTYNGTVISGETGPTLTDTRAGNYGLTVTAPTNCVVTQERSITLAPATEGNLSSLYRICPEPENPDPNTREAVLRPGNFVSYEWFREGNTLGSTDSVYYAIEEGRYSVELINSFGCASTDQTRVIVDCDPVIVGPNAFRPSSSVTQNGDLVNQTFKLFTFFVDDDNFRVLIFNRWGEMVFQSSERDFRWNGGYNNNLGQLLPPGTYSYVVQYQSSYRPGEGIREKRGGVVLMR